VPPRWRGFAIRAYLSGTDYNRIRRADELSEAKSAPAFIRGSTSLLPLQTNN